MISWMQKHRKYLVITIWISTIAFVGAGFVGWGTYQYGGKSNNVAKVGDVPVTMQEFQTAYGNVYQQYNQAMGGKLDEATAKKMGLQKQVLQSLIYQALLKNFAKEHNIVVSDEEVQQAILNIPAFQKNGRFDKSTYIAVLQSMRMKPKTFEANLKNEILLNKTLSLLNPGMAPLELEAFGSAIFMADRLRYKVFSAEEIQVSFSDDELKRYWEEHKSDYMTPKRYKLAILWITPSTELPEEPAIESFYKEHRTDFTDSEGKILPLEKVREEVVEKLRLKTSKKAAQLAYIDLKKGKKAAEEEKTVDAGDTIFPAEVWEEIEGALPGTVLKPKIVGGRYAVIKVIETILPQPKSFEKAYDDVKVDYLSKKRLELLQKMAEKASAQLDDAQLSDYVTRDSVDKLPPLTKEEAAAFLQKLFSTNRPNGAILLDNKAVSYSIVEQKLLNSDKLEQHKTFIEENAKKMKSNLLQSNLIDRLQQKYTIEIYLKETE
ncbi:peptidylprolyl isomerase [Hydrogenimonas cancrithermarum]|uniref:Peptidyl-prolyl cis-trans isomerase n=1 Tax=Hydrogenimonas cancrithermarum TaxID=2993563 RepID=A0ABM8FIK6_9BACT|nr:peptidylprolyl isomerase [Hydrogenimonas cancrithermarum]BDY12115.1 peptidyl-prolyl cis-trans isomerase [Hydrogenimonas cancrithermarum]